MQEFCDVRIETLKVNKKEVEKLKKLAHKTKWGYRTSNYFGPTKFIMTRRFKDTIRAALTTSLQTEFIRRKTKKVIRVDRVSRWYEEYK